jgi:methyl-accepting chemotaxis protein
MFSNLRIGTKLILTSMVVILLTAILGIFAIIENTRLNTIAKDIATIQIPAIQAIANMNALVGSYRRAELLMTLASDKQDQEKYIKRNKETLEKLKKEQATYETLMDTEDERKGYADFKKSWEAYLAEYPKIEQLALENNDEDAAKLIMGTSSKMFNQALAALEGIAKFNVDQTQKQSNLCFKINSTALIGISILLVVCIAIGLVLAVLMARKISKPIAYLARKAQLIAEGDLSSRIEQRSNDEIGMLAGAFGMMVDNLKNVVVKLVDTSQQLATAAGQLQTSAEQMAAGTEEVISQASTVATASEEMAATSSEIAQNCSMAAQSSQEANNAAMTGASVIQATVEGMDRIADRVRGTSVSVENLGSRSEQIGAIVGTIEDIADQTNLLALNAAIEAARAGEQGRGFAVVADEVRALAERTTKATREIGDMIKAIQGETRIAVNAMEEGVKEVALGTEEAARSGEALQAILNQINSVTMQVNQIATAAEEQTATTNQISSNILQINSVVQETGRGAQESAAAASRLASLSGELQTIIRRFKL